jgi:hypothetical protein
MYAGARWKQGCHPDEFMKENEYQTSSSTISDIIDQEGLQIFEVLRIETNLDGLSAYDYETLFLQENDCAGSENWYNGHNNIGCPPPYGTDAFKKNMMEKYGVYNIMKIPEIRIVAAIKQKETNMEKYGVEYVSQVPEFMIKKQVSMERTNMEKYGVGHILQVPEIKVKQQIAQEKTIIEKYGYENTFQVPEFKDKGKISKLQKYGSETFNNREKSKQTCLEKYGVEHINQLKFLSVIDNKLSYSKSHLTRYFPDFKQYY